MLWFNLTADNNRIIRMTAFASQKKYSYSKNAYLEWVVAVRIGELLCVGSINPLIDNTLCYT